MQPPQPPGMTEAALAWHAAGCCVIRTAVDGTKRPLGAWQTYQTTTPDPGTLRAWFADQHPGLGLVTGAISGHLELLELEGRAVADGIGTRFLDALDDHGLGDLKHRILSGYTEVSPSGGLHMLYRVTGGVGGNTKLAQRRGTQDPATGRAPVEALIETRGEGGFVVVAPSHGPTHETGNPWRTSSGAPESIPTITADDRDALHAVACLFDELPPPAPMPDPVAFERREPGAGQPPGGDFNERGQWPEILEPAGWTRVRQLGDRTYWRRPGKRLGLSAVTGGGGADFFWCWSTSTELPAEQAMSKWRVYAHLHHGGDFHTAASTLRGKGYGDRLPEPTRPVLTVVGSAPPPPVDGTAAKQPAAPPEPLNTYARSDDGNALALVDTYGAVIRYCTDRGRWYDWTGQRWRECASGGGHVREYAKRVARALPEDNAADARHKARSLGAIGTSAMLVQAATDPRVTVQLADLDARPFELNTPAGVVDLRTGTITPHDPEKLHTRITACAPDPAADDGPWQQFLADTFAEHGELPAYLQRLVGYSVTGVIREHVLPFAHGSGANGKGVFLETLRGVLGDYATTAPSGFLMARSYSAHETEIARLAGARMVVCSEVNEGDRFDEAKVKQLTGGDTLTARFMRQDHFTFAPTHKLWLMGNHRPSVNGGGHSFWRRLRLIPFTQTVPENRQVEDLQTILAHDHGPAVLAWVIAGARDYFAGGLAEPDSVRAATAEYAHDQDTVARFVEDCCHLGGGDHVLIRMGKLRQAYERWCLAEGAQAVSSTTLGTTLRTRFAVGRTARHSTRFYTGITLLADDDTDDSNRYPESPERYPDAQHRMDVR